MPQFYYIFNLFKSVKSFFQPNPDNYSIPIQITKNNLLNKILDSPCKKVKSHILFIVENSTVPIDVRVWSEALAAKEYGHKVSVICPKSNIYRKHFENIQGIHIYRHPVLLAKDKITYIIEYLSALIFELLLSVFIYLKNPFHILHGANPPDHLFIIAIIFKSLGVKYIFDHHDLSPESYVAKFKSKGFFYKLLLYMENANFKFSDLVISTNQSYKSVAIKRGGKKDSDVFVVRNGPRLDQIKIPYPNPEWKGSFKYLVAYLGVIGSQDQLDVLLKIADIIVNVRKNNSIKFIIIGDGPNLKQIKNMSNDMNLDKHIEFTGFVPYGEKLFEILSTADVCVNPEYKNAFTDKSTMIKILEYMCFGKPIIQFETTEGRVSAGDAALYVKNNNIDLFCDLLIDLLRDKNKCKKMGEIGKKRVSKYLQWKVQKANLIEAYTTLLNS